MADVIRRAVIELAVRQQRAQIQAPDISNLEQLRQAHEAAGKAAEEAASKVEKSASRQVAAEDSHLESLRARSKFMAESDRQLASVRATLAKDTERAAALATAAAQDEIKAQQQRAAAHESAERRVVEATLRQSQAFSQLSVRSFQMARGLAFVAAGSSEVSQTLLRVVVAAQGAFDVLGGALGVVRNYNRFLRATSDAAKAAAAAEALRTGATAASIPVTVASTGAVGALTLAVKALNVQLLALLKNPVVLAIAALLAVIWLAVKAYDALTTSEEEAAEAARKKAEADRKAAEAIQLRTSYAEAQREAQQAEIEFLDNVDQKLARTIQLREQAALAIEKETASRFAANQLATSGNPEQAAALLERQVQIRQTEIELGRQQIRLEEEKAQAVARTADEKLREIQLADQRLQKADQELKRQKEIEASARQQLGQLSRQEQSQLLRAVDQLQSGKAVTDRQLQLLAGQTRTNPLARAEFERRGSGLDAELAKRGLGSSADLRQAEIESNNASADVQKATGGKSVEQAIADLEKLKGDAQTHATAAIQAVNSTMRMIIDEMVDLQKEMLTYRHAAQNTQ